MDDLIIKGVQKTSFIDYPGKICSVIFLSRCNFRCSYCYNPELVLDKSEQSQIKEDEIIDFLRQKSKWIEAVCITGGEPTIHPGLKRFVQKIKSIGLLVKLDTNGTNPEVVEDLIKEKLVDYVAMDIKAGEANYEKVSKANLMDKIKRTIGILKRHDDAPGFDYEFRTTVHPDFFDETELLAIIELIKGSKRYVMQQFKPDFDSIDKVSKKMYSNDIMNKFLRTAEPHFRECRLKGVS